jgi:Fe-S oxidoreductase
MGNTQENAEADREESKELKRCLTQLAHLKSQFHTRYRYLLGEWQGSVKAKSTDTGEFVSLDEVRRYMDGQRQSKC